MKRTEKFSNEYKQDNRLENEAKRIREKQERKNNYEYDDSQQFKEQWYQTEIKRQKKKKRWFGIGFLVLLVVAVLLAFNLFKNNDNDVSDEYAKQVNEQNQSMNDEVNTAKDNIKNKETSDQEIQNLRNQVNELKQNEQNQNDSTLTEKYEKQIQKLEEANTALKNNVDQKTIEDKLDNVKSDFDDFKSKWEEWIDSIKNS
ncbi:TPA: hypothetical protein O6S24_002026 [Staphylococcus aureus]|uniref:hypothetical protein n=1 Tax=Staphylococcus aureus TaxID=1280 RepID=UPI00065BE3B7|nr:hypothetical protein [Staphylococcus aureus]KMR50916.1 hypothetical protein EX85_09525 [Staphylococcus aureus]HDB3993371.1 hypothetical protein [Staphylococcus aureus]HDB3997084.1 hypothetical protein [Staphylococcus aureus]HDB4002758.1 hypothetical protein [Staphylococcus aureus]HDB4005426.1 hypothetical protein [Staphylococcus aureus]